VSADNVSCWSSYYYKGVGESALNLELMCEIDKQYMETPFYGYPRMTAHLLRKGYKVNRKRVRRLMRQMGIEAIYPKRRTSVRNLHVSGSGNRLV